MKRIKKYIKKILYYIEYYISCRKAKKYSVNKTNRILKNDLVLENIPDYQYFPYSPVNHIQSVPINYNLSIIIPVYNAEKFIFDCLQSLLSQKTDYKFQIIVVNDGSTDKTQEILLSFSKDPRIKIFHKPNGGISSARNFGLEKAEGEYIGFIDNDDWVSDTYIETLLTSAYEHSADIVKCGYKSIYPDNSEVLHCNNKSLVLKNGINDEILKFDGLIWGGIQHKRIWSKCAFPEHYWFEDMISRGLIYRLAKKFVYINEPLYFKREHNSNASKIHWKVNTPKCLDQVILAGEIIKIDKILKINDNNTLIKVLLYELGLMLFYRTSKAYRELAFNLASSIIVQNFSIEDSMQTNLSSLDKSLLLSFFYNDYLLWLHTVKCQNYKI